MEMKRDLSKVFYRIAYTLFVLLAVYQIVINKDYIEAATNLGIGLIFDPFNPKVSWQDRPLWQRAWLIIHLALAAALFGYGVSVDG